MTVDDITPEKRECLVEDVTEADLNGFIATANSAIFPFDLEIRSTFHQTSRTRVFALINSTSNALTQLATVHSTDEISFLKANPGCYIRNLQYTAPRNYSDHIHASSRSGQAVGRKPKRGVKRRRDVKEFRARFYNSIDRKDV